jgi:hypothetical protein
MARRDLARVIRVRRALLIAAVVGLTVLAACGSDDDDGVESGGDDVTTTSGPQPTEPAPAELQAEIDQVGSSLRITWTITNQGDAELVVFDNRRPGEDPDTERSGAYVTGHDDTTAEISRRLFPVPDDLEGVQAYGVTASSLAPGDTTTGREIVLLPLQHIPAAPDGGGDPPPDDPRQVVFCAGVAPADLFPASTSSSAPAGYRFARHSRANVEHQTLLCSDPVDLT